MKIIQKVHDLVCDESIINKFCIAYEDISFKWKSTCEWKYCCFGECI